MNIPPPPARWVSTRVWGAAALGVAFSIGSSADLLEAQAAVELRTVRFAVDGDSKRIVLRLDATVAYSLGRLSAPERLYLDLADTRPGPALRGGRIAVHDPLVRLIRVGQPQAGITRVVLDLNEPAEPDVFWQDAPPRLVVVLRRPAPPPPARPRESIPAMPAGAEAPAPAPSSAPSPVPLPAASPAPAEYSRTLRISRVAEPPRLSDFPGRAPQQVEGRVDDFVQRTPDDGVPVSQPTSAYLSYDDDNLYAVFVCVDDPQQVRGHLAKREVIGGDDRVSLYLDTFQDHRRAYVFSANPLGIQQDSILTDGQADDLRFDTVWHARGRRTANGYVVWMAIPFKSLRFSDRSVQTWGIALGRTIPRKNETAFWPHISRRVLSFTSQMGTLEGIRKVSPTRNVQLVPYGAFTRARLLGSGGSFLTTDHSRGGLDAKLVVRNALTFDATLNPDFSQVESDDPQVTINQRFEVFFPEKRPFFIENAGFFQTPINLFFSRRIVDPEFGLRLTGKMGPWALGVLAADDRAAGRGLPATDPLRDDRAGTGAFRLQRDVGRQSTVGVLATTRVFGSGLNQVVALDSRLQLGANWSLSGQVAQSYERAADGTRLDGTASYAQLLRGGEHLSYLGSYTDRSPGFRSQVGFIQRVDIRQTDHHLSYLWQPQGSSLSSFGPGVSGGANWNHQGRLQDWYASGEFSMDFTGPAGFSVSHAEAYELFLDTEFRQHATTVNVYSSQLQWLSISGSYSWGTGVNYSAPDPPPPFLGNDATANATITLRPTPRLRVDQAYFFSQLATRGSNPPAGATESGLVFRNHLWRTKVNYQFSKALSLRAILDYDATAANPVLIAESPFQRFRGDVLLTYLTQPGTAFYIGYTDRYDSVVVDLTTPPTLRATRTPRTSTARQFFVKVSYLFRF